VPFSSQVGFASSTRYYSFWRYERTCFFRDASSDRTISLKVNLNGGTGRFDRFELDEFVRMT
jgi:hypothetical protein